MGGLIAVEEIASIYTEFGHFLGVRTAAPSGFIIGIWKCVGLGGVDDIGAVVSIFS